MIRQARKEDAEEIVELFKVVLTDMELPIMRKIAWKKLKPVLVDATKREKYLYGFKHATVKEVDGEIAGFFFGYDGGLDEEEYEPLASILDEYDLPVFESNSDDETFEGEWYLDTLVTKSRFRGRGIGKELMQAAYRKAEKKGIPVVGLNVDQDNPKAQKLYKRQGFEKTGEIVLADRRYDHMQKVIN